VAVTLGAGGTLVEWLADTTILLAPVTRTELRRALGRLRIGRRLERRAGGSVIDPEPIYRVIDRLTSLVAARPDIVEVEVNPLILTGDGAWAADALISVTRGAVPNP
jgi:succinyl-CoA synthetase beta subunit